MSRFDVGRGDYLGALSGQPIMTQRWHININENECDEDPKLSRANLEEFYCTFSKFQFLTKLNISLKYIKIIITERKYNVYMHAHIPNNKNNFIRKYKNKRVTLYYIINVEKILVNY